MLIAIVIIIMLAIAFYEVPSIVQEEKWDELKVFSGLWIAALVLAILQTTGVNIPNPTAILVKTMPPLTKAAGSLLGF